MERSVAIKKLSKLLGSKFGYRVDPKAPTADEREEAKLALPALNAERERLSKLKDARFRELLDGDAEYQRLFREHKAARDKVEQTFSMTRHYRFTVGTSMGMFFAVKAEGDSWEEVIRLVEADKAKCG